MKAIAALLIVCAGATAARAADAPDARLALERLFADAEKANVFVEVLYLEPVMGEGNPGQSITRAFYDAARRLTRAHGTLLVVDSIQAGLRAHGVLSIVDYPGFENMEAPDMETYSKAINGGQYPLSVLAVNERAAALYRKGVYGNTMTTNPRALDIAATVLGSLTPELRANIQQRGRRHLCAWGEVDRQTKGVADA